MRILYFTRDYTPHDYRFLNSLAEKDHQVYYLRLERRGTVLEDRPLPAKVENIIWAGGQKPARWQDGWNLRAGLVKVVRRLKPDIIHAGPLQTSALLSASIGFHPLVSMSWGSDILIDAERNFWWRLATRYALTHSDVLIGDCQAVRLKAREFGLSDDRIVTFPWGVDLDHFSPRSATAIRARLGWEDAFVLISLRSWEAIYGVDVLVNAFIEAARRLPELRLILLGNGSQSAKLHHLIELNQMDDRVFFGGQVKQSELPEYYRSADLYLSASHSDGSSVSLMEALACAKPVLVSDIPSNREWITDGKEGWLFPDSNIQALADKIYQAANQRSSLGPMGAQARLLAEQRADWDRNFQMLLKAYEKAKFSTA